MVPPVITTGFDWGLAGDILACAQARTVPSSNPPKVKMLFFMSLRIIGCFAFEWLMFYFVRHYRPAHRHHLRRPTHPCAAGACWFLRYRSLIFRGDHFLD